MVTIYYKVAVLGGLDFWQRIKRQPMLKATFDAPARDPGYIASLIPRPPGMSVFVFEIYDDNDRRVWSIDKRRYVVE